MPQLDRKNIKFYSQHGEDYLLWEYFDFKSDGFFIEVGAFDGKYLSNSYSFEQQGWFGLCIEPHPDFFPMCQENRKGSLCINRACVGNDQEEVILQADPTGLFSGLDNDSFRKEYVGAILKNKEVEFDGFQTHSVKADKLDDILLDCKSKARKIDFISIDVEGTEIDVLNGFDLEGYSPEVIAIEANSDDHQKKLIQYLEKLKYYFVRKLGVNLFFVNSQDCIKKLNDIVIRCSVERQVHPLGEKYSVDAITHGLHIDEEKDNLISSQKVAISRLTSQVAELKNTTGWQKRLIEDIKMEIENQSVAKGQLKGERDWFQKKGKKLEELNDVMACECKAIANEKEKVAKKYNELQKLFYVMQEKFNQLSKEPIVYRYIKLKKYFQDRPFPVVKVFSSRGLKKKIIVNVQYGLGNRLRALASAQLLAQKTGRELVLLWIPDIHCQAQFNDLFVNDLNVIDSLDKVNIDQADIYNYMDSEEGSEKNKFVNDETSKDIYVKSAFVLNHKFANDEEINSLLQQLEPVQEIKSIVDQFEIQNRVGLHIREGGGRKAHRDPWDNAENWSEKGKENLFYWREKSRPQVFMKELDRLLAKDPDVCFFLAADSEEIYSQFQERYKDKIEYLKRDLYDRSIDQQKYALADMILLSRTKYILGSYWSSFSEIAQRFGGNEMKHSGKDF